jgi:hypothetical protein
VAKYQSLVQGTGDTPGGYCLGTGMPGSMLGSGGYPMEIHQRPEQIMIVYEAHNEVRRVYLGDRIVPEADRLPGRNGHSSGRWEGNTLVVETGHLIEQVDQRYAHSSKAKIVERYHLEKGAKGETVLAAEMTLTDPGVLYSAGHGREEVGEGAERPPAALRVRGKKLDQASGSSSRRRPGSRSRAEVVASAEKRHEADCRYCGGGADARRSVAAHHSAIQFDFANSKAVTGVVMKFIAINPHMQLVLRVKDAKGERDIEFEGHSTNNMYRAGYRDNMIKVGDTITVYIAPLRTAATVATSRQR